ncbi:hypothetical protein GMRT_10297 [Giardia muris]|uniref:Uncharacterized protein n=1 Tax=Giardia muris TaxID=5742 RepID=A0A4Z1SVH5_GIAMU|nr:hypothetical protein GMRT_10297 [Giardia muris]|eukprot:TNJ29872.1 hypothetical protein GMRT_10297 [Giardia muris]
MMHSTPSDVASISFVEYRQNPQNREQLDREAKQLRRRDFETRYQLKPKDVRTLQSTYSSVILMQEKLIVVLNQIPIVIQRSLCCIVLDHRSSGRNLALGFAEAFPSLMVSRTHQIDAWELNCLESLLFYLSRTIQSKYKSISQYAAKLFSVRSLELQTLVEACQRLRLEVHIIHTALSNILDDDQEVARLSFENQKYISQYTSTRKKERADLHMRTCQSFTDLKHSRSVSSLSSKSILLPETELRQSTLEDRTPLTLRHSPSSRLIQPGELDASLADEACWVQRCRTFAEVKDDVLESTPISVGSIHDIFETCLAEATVIRASVDNLMRNVITNTRIAELRLDGDRNSLLTFKLYLGLFTLSVKAASLPGGLLGMNLLNPWLPATDDPGPFYVSGSLLPFWALSGISLLIFLTTFGGLCLAYRHALHHKKKSP